VAHLAVLVDPQLDEPVMIRDGSKPCKWRSAELARAINAEHDDAGNEAVVHRGASTQRFTCVPQPERRPSEEPA
jgi:hypothetical protein